MRRLDVVSSVSRHGQKGIVLVIALVVLVAMTLAAIALSRSVDITTQIAGNLAYRQSGVQAADAAVEIARDWLIGRDASALNADIGPSYYAWMDGGGSGSPTKFDPTTIDWSNKSGAPKDAAGNTAAYVIHRMCKASGSVATTSCFGLSPDSTSQDGHDAGAAEISSSAYFPYYRITVRVIGPKNTVTYVQAVIY